MDRTQENFHANALYSERMIAIRINTGLKMGDEGAQLSIRT